jgi:hypothetical protein
MELFERNTRRSIETKIQALAARCFVRICSVYQEKDGQHHASEVRHLTNQPFPRPLTSATRLNREFHKQGMSSAGSQISGPTLGGRTYWEEGS